MVDKTFFKNNGPFTLAQIAKIVEGELADGVNAKDKVSDISTMESATENDVCFFYDRKSKEKATNIKAKACVTTKELKEWIPQGVSVIVCDNPKLAFMKLNASFYEEYLPEKNIAESARIHKTAKIGKNCHIGENVVVEENATIGDNCRIDANAHIARACKIGNNCHIGAGVSIAYTIMGNDCYIYSGARIGYDGFGFNTIAGKHHRIPQIGRVIIGNDVEIGANSWLIEGH